MNAARYALIGLIAILPDAHAADLPFEGPTTPPVFTWTGFYTGTFAGFGSLKGRADQTCANAGPASCDRLPGGRMPDADGFVGGSQAGYNVEAPLGLLFGVEGDFQFTRLRGFDQAVAVSQPFGAGTARALGIGHVGRSLDDFGTLRGRIGYAFGPTLVYATGGLAVAELRFDANRTDDFGFAALTNQASRSNLRTGFVVGGGAEYALSDHLSAKVEAVYFDLGSTALRGSDDAGLGLVRGARIDTYGTLVRAGLNYHFDDGGSLLGTLNKPLDTDEPLREPETDWTASTGFRYFYSTGRYKKTLADNVQHDVTNSRLTYANADAHAGESFVRLDHNPSGLFLKGFLGSGGIVSGHLNDEDFPPAINPYSNTLSQVRGGDIAYASVDAGYNLYRDEAVSLEAFVGYHYLAETLNAYGCGQVAGGDVCAPPIGSAVKALSQDAVWNSLRVGGAVATRFDRFTLSTEAAYLPVVELSAYDRHWLRPDINPLPETGWGTGYQVEATLSYDVTHALSVGAGGRYWFMQASRGAASFPASTPSPLKSETERYGGFLQASYKFHE